MTALVLGASNQGQSLPDRLLKRGPTPSIVGVSVLLGVKPQVLDHRSDDVHTLTETVTGCRLGRFVGNDHEGETTGIPDLLDLGNDHFHDLGTAEKMVTDGDQSAEGFGHVARHCMFLSLGSSAVGALPTPRSLAESST